MTDFWVKLEKYCRHYWRLTFSASVSNSCRFSFLILSLKWVASTSYLLKNQYYKPISNSRGSKILKLYTSMFCVEESYWDRGNFQYSPCNDHTALVLCNILILHWIEEKHAERITFQNREQDVHLLREGVFQNRYKLFPKLRFWTSLNSFSQCQPSL